jgi:hypothetical protein
VVTDPNESNLGNIKNKRRAVNGHFMKKRKKYLKAKIDELEITVS